MTLTPGTAALCAHMALQAALKAPHSEAAMASVAVADAYTRLAGAMAANGIVYASTEDMPTGDEFIERYHDPALVSPSP
jgi:hypothetical protein